MNAWELKRKYKNRYFNKNERCPKVRSRIWCSPLYLDWDVNENSFWGRIEAVNDYGKVYWIGFGFDFNDDYMITKVWPVSVDLYGGDDMKYTHLSSIHRTEEHYNLIDAIFNKITYEK